uniref:7TM_GPCR_Srx domain-containing protein n=1 Tax=Parastrongyloides trichosuri TaxID=131310 RepID=A0A0N4ZJS3_PARTI
MPPENILYLILLMILCGVFSLAGNVNQLVSLYYRRNFKNNEEDVFSRNTRFYINLLHMDLVGDTFAEYIIWFFDEIANVNMTLSPAISWLPLMCLSRQLYKHDKQEENNQNSYSKNVSNTIVNTKLYIKSKKR